MQKLGPNQEIWIQALESGKYPQGKRNLNNNGRFCCLGVACEIFSHDLRLKRTSALPFFSQDYSDVAISYANEEDPEPCFSLAPISVVRKLALIDEAGHINDYLEYASLASMNDNGLKFAAIAKFIRENPEKVFTETK